MSLINIKREIKMKYLQQAQQWLHQWLARANAMTQQLIASLKAQPKVTLGIALAIAGLTLLATIITTIIIVVRMRKHSAPNPDQPSHTPDGSNTRKKTGAKKETNSHQNNKADNKIGSVKMTANPNPKHDDQNPSKQPPMSKVATPNNKSSAQHSQVAPNDEDSNIEWGPFTSGPVNMSTSQLGMHF